MDVRSGLGAVVRAEGPGSNPLWELAQHTTKSGASKPSSGRRAPKLSRRTLRAAIALYAPIHRVRQ
jgi:hypothetical protein